MLFESQLHILFGWHMNWMLDRGSRRKCANGKGGVPSLNQRRISCEPGERGGSGNQPDNGQTAGLPTAEEAVGSIGVVRWEVSAVAWRSPPAYFITQLSMKARFGDLKILPYKEGSRHLSSVHVAGHRLRT